MMDNPQSRRTVYSVSELNSTIRRLLESEFPLLWVEGEISNLARPASGHIYFTLKDSKSQVRCAMFKGRNQLLRFKPENGQQIVIHAKPGLYEARGEYQLIAEHMEAAGDGALQRAYDELKQRLQKEGLFNENLKQPIPESITRIALITSGTGAAVKDVISVLHRRFPAIEINLFPVAVQGDQAAAQIINALRLANELNRHEVILLVRGGGSLEDLWAFNEEALARAISASHLPIVTGVGHEIDFTIADFVADVRAATPSAAAELVSPSQQAYLHRIQASQKSLIRYMQNRLERAEEQSHWIQNRLKTQHPSNQLMQQSQHLDDLGGNLLSAMQRLLSDKKHRLKYSLQSLVNNRPDPFIEYQKIQLGDLTRRLIYLSELNMTNRQQQLANISRTLQAVSPLNTLSRGYSICRDAQGRTVREAKQLSAGDIITTQLSQGEITSKVEKKRIS
ncbi:Exodeoxyribonuclease VII large subunit [hydrothermal vent metagenome]|uniref:Exodeoxyribonuclease VII large subunit n=1 Tax=hydrothermal vent metagenome TaxID=652676 RepID=A0A3B0XXW3_9ZZZZ